MESTADCIEPSRGTPVSESLSGRPKPPNELVPADISNTSMTPCNEEPPPFAQAPPSTLALSLSAAVNCHDGTPWAAQKTPPDGCPGAASERLALSSIFEVPSPRVAARVRSLKSLFVPNCPQKCIETDLEKLDWEHHPRDLLLHDSPTCRIRTPALKTHCPAEPL